MKIWINKHESAASLLLLFLITLICFLPLSNQTGYYLNDWHPLAGKLNGVAPFQMWAHERYGVGFLYSITYPILGDHLFLWQLFTIGLRLVSAIGFWWLTRIIWKGQYLFSISAAIIFLVYPGFMEQSIALTFSNHFIGINLAIFSIIFTLKSIYCTSGRRKTLFISLAILLELAYLFTYEYMLGYEVVRIILIWYILYRPFIAGEFWKTLKRLIISSLPYLIGLGLFLFWRVFVFKSTRPTTNMGLLAQSYLNQPVTMISRIFLETFRDLIESIWAAWSVPFNQYVSSAPYGNLAISIGLAALGSALFWLIIKNSESGQAQTSSESKDNKNTLYLDSFWIGLITVCAALIPVILSNREVKFNNQMDRYTLHAVMGIALLLTGFIFHWVKINGRKFILVFLLGIAIITQFNNTAAYTTWWNYQTSLWWQLSWRAPDIRDGTVVLPLLPFGNRLQEDIEVWTPIKAIYRSEEPGVSISAEVINSDTVLNVFFQEQTYRIFRGGIQYSRDFHYPLIISYSSSESCVHIIDGERLELSPNDESIIYRIAPFSQINRIITSGEEHLPPRQVFGNEPTHDWCYYYQKVSLARQQEDWLTATELADEAITAGLEPNDVTEWLPFIESYINADQLANAELLVTKVRSNKKSQQNLCSTWQFERSHKSEELMKLICDE